MNLQCNTCGATYVDVLPDGMEYYHACAPLSPAEIRAGLAAGTIALTKTQAAQLAALQAAKPAAGQPAPLVAPDEAYLATLVIERPNKRDENLRIDPITKQPTIKAAGAGVTEILAAV